MEMINGFPCRTCSDVDLAKKHIDPAKPDDGPYGRDAKGITSGRIDDVAVSFGGTLSFLNDARVNPVSAIAGPAAAGLQSPRRLDVLA